MANSSNPVRPGKPDVIVCADWSKNRSKRSVYIARVVERSVKKATGVKWSFTEILKLANKEREHGRVLVSFDVPLGVPASYFEAAKGEHGWQKARNFLEWLPLALSIPDFIAPVGMASEWKVTRPYFTVTAGKGGYGNFEEAAKTLKINLKRRIDTATGGKSAFAIGIPGHVAPAAQSLWSELAIALTQGESFSVWPFSGELGALIDAQPVVVGEIYPRAAYATALAAKLPARHKPLKKSKCSVRSQSIESLRAAEWVRTFGVSVNDFESALDSEDDFDALMTAGALLRSTLEDLPLSNPSYEDSIAEGGILGTGTITFGGGK